MLAAYAASLVTPAQLCHSQSSSLAHVSAHLVDRGGVSSTHQPGDLRHEVIDDHADRAVYTLPPCEHYPFGGRDRGEAPELRALELPQFVLDKTSSISGHMRLIAPAQQLQLRLGMCSWTLRPACVR